MENNNCESLNQLSTVPCRYMCQGKHFYRENISKYAFKNLKGVSKSCKAFV